MKKIFLLFICLILFIVSVAAVSAAEDVNQTITDDNNNVINSGDTLSVSLSENEIQGDVGAGTFTDLQLIINEADEGSIINLTMNYAYDSSIDTDGISIDKQLTIDGNAYTINGNNKARAFSVSHNNVTLKNIEFTNCSASYSGGAVYWDGADYGVLANCSFVNSSASSGGGAVYWNGADYGVLANCSFVNSSATYGGAVYWNGADYGVLANCSFVNSSTSYGCGAVYWGGAYGVLANCSFVNSSASSGGAVDWNGADGVLANCSFVNSSSRYNGGAVYWNGADGVLANCSFVNSSASSGGAVYWNGADGVLANCSFVNSSASSGGAVYWNGADYGVLANCSFVNSSASGAGGAVYWYLDADYGVLANCSFVNSSASYGCGAVYWYGADGVLANCSFVNSSAIGAGGAVYWNGADGVLANCSFVNSSSRYNGGAVYWGGDNGVLANCSFVNSSSRYNGGAVYWGGDNGVVIESSFKYCRAGEYGGGIYFDADDCSLINPYFEGNSATGGSDWYSTQPLNVTNKTTISTVLSAFDVITTYAGSAKLIVTLKDIYNNDLIGEQISISLNNKEYDLITDSRGQVLFYIPSDLAPKTYYTSISYAGNEIYEPSYTTANIVINKAGTIISAPNVSLTYKDPNGELVATIINEHGKPLVVNLNININGKDYAVRTDSNGQASIPIDTLSPGKYDTTISYKGNGNYNASSTTAKVTVTKANTSISVDKKSLDLEIGDDSSVTATLTPADAGNVTFTSSNPSVVTVDKNGKVTAVGVGSATITVSYAGSDKYNAAKNVIVAVNVGLNDAKVVAKDITLNVGAHITITTTTTPKGLKVTYTQDNSGVVTVKDGVVTAVKAGTAKITLTVGGDDKYAKNSTTITVTVKKIDTNISVDEKSLDLKVGDNSSVTIKLTPVGAGNVVFISSNPSVVTVDKNGKVKAIGVGSATVTVSYAGSDKYNAAKNVTVAVTVKKIDTSISVDEKSLDLKVGDNFGVTAKLTPAEAGKVTFTSSNPSVVAVDKNGKVKAVGVGSATVTVSYAGSDKYNAAKDSIVVVVKEYKYVILAPDVTKYYGGSERFIVTVTDSDDNPLSDQSISIIINGITYSRTTGSNGMASIALNLPSEEYDVIVDCDDNSIKSKVSILPTVYGSDIVKMFNDDTQYYATFLDSEGNYLSKGTSVQFYINNVLHTQKIIDFEGTAKLDIDETPGEYIITATNPVTGEKASNSITVLSNTDEIIGYKIAFFKNETIIDLSPNKIKFGVKNLTEIEYDENNNYIETYSITLSTFKVNGKEYIIEEYYPTMGQYGHNVYEKFNPKEYECYDGIFYKINGNSIEDIINPVEYHVFDGEYYKLVGVMTPIEEFEGEIEGEKEVYCIINNTCYKFVGATIPYVVGFFYTTTEGVDYNIIDGKYYTLNGDLIKSFVFVFFGEDEDENDDIIRNGIYLTNRDNIYYSGQAPVDYIFFKDKIGMRYSIAPYIYVKVNDTFYKLISGTGTYNTTEEYAGEKYNVTKHNEYIILNNQLYNFINGDIASKVNLIENITNNLIIKAPDVTKYYGGSERFAVTIMKDDKPLANKEVIITLNGQSYRRTTNENGQTSIGINLNSGKYDVAIECDGINVKSIITVKSTVSGKDITKIYKNGTQYYSTFVDSKGNLLKNTKVKLNINGVFYERTTNDDGTAKMNINLNPGTYILTATNPDSTEQYTNIVKVLPSIVENNDLTKYYRNASQYTLRLLDEKGNPVGAGVTIDLNINGVFYKRTSNATGYVKMNINLNPGTYIITAEYNGLRASNTIKVLPTIQTKDLYMKYRDGSKFEAKILDDKGKPYAGQSVTYNINGVFYNRISDDNGIARLNINLQAGQYIITTTFNGLNEANKVTISS